MAFSTSSSDKFLSRIYSKHTGTISPRLYFPVGKTTINVNVGLISYDFEIGAGTRISYDYEANGNRGGAHGTEKGKEGALNIFINCFILLTFTHAVFYFKVLCYNLFGDRPKSISREKAGTPNANCTGL